MRRRRGGALSARGLRGLLVPALLVAAGCGARSSVDVVALSDGGADPGGGGDAGGSGGAGGAATTGGVQLTPQPAVPTGKRPTDLHVADFDGDARLDVAVVSHDSDAVGVHLGHGGGALSGAATYPTGFSPLLFTVADMNLDGSPDVITADHGTLSVLFGDGDGALGPPASTGFCQTTVGIASGDVSGDGVPDVIASCAADKTYLVAGATDGTLTAFATLSGDSTLGIALGDVNDDGALDIARSGPGGGVSVLLDSGGGTFGDPAFFPVPGTPYPVTLTDLNGDETLDLAVGAGGPDIPALSVLLGLGNGAFQPAESFLPGAQTQFLATGDFDGDGHTDLVSSTVPGEIQLVFGHGDGTFSGPQTFTVPTYLTGMVTGDMNADGKPDLVVLLDPDYKGDTGMSGSVQVLLNTTP